MTEFYYCSRFFGVKRGVVEADLGDTLALRVGDSINTVRKADIDSPKKRADDGGWWSSMDIWADRVVADAESWANELQSREDNIDADIADLRRRKSEDTADGRRRLDEAREWRAKFEFDPVKFREEETKTDE